MVVREKLYTSHEAADLLQMDASSIVKWVNDGILVAYRTPGGHRRVRATDLIAFLRAQGMWVPPELSAGKRKLPLVDDEPRVLSGMKRAMKAFENEVEFFTAESGVEALVAVGAEHPDALALDFAMPGMNGLELLRQLKSNPKTKDIEVIMLSGNLDQAIRVKALALGASAVLDKPVSAAELVGLVTGRKPYAPGKRTTQAVAGRHL